MNIPHKGEFQPSSDSLKAWLATRKPEHNVAGTTYPGFFSDTDFSKDAAWFYFAFIGELVGLGMTIYGGAQSGGLFFVIAVVIVTSFIICDFAFAKLLHKREALKCELRSRKMVTDTQTVYKIEEELKQGKLVEFILKTCIILIALIKVFGIILLGVFNAFTLYIPFAIIFILIAYVHINHTGYYFAYRNAENSILNDCDLFRREGHYKALSINHPFDVDTRLEQMPIKYHPHEIIENMETTDNLKDYKIKALGVLADDEIYGLMASQNEGNQIKIFKACRRAQLQILNMQPSISKRKKFLGLFTLLPFLILLSSCQKNKAIEYFKLSIVITHDLNANEGDPLNSGLKTLCNYCTDTACGDKVFIPEVSIIRADLNPQQTEAIVVPLSSVNNFRKSMKLLSATNLMQEYDEQIPNLKITKTLAIKSSQPIDVNSLIQKYPEANLLCMDDSMAFNIKNIKDEICQGLCKVSKNNFTIILYPSNSGRQIPKQIKIMAQEQINSFTNQLMDAKGNTDTLKKISQEIKTYDADADFNVEYLLAIKTICGKRHILAFQHLINAAKVAISTNKSVTMLGYFERDKEDKAKLWRLANKHEEIWNPINEALQKKNPKILDSIDLAGEAAEHHESLEEHD